MAKQKVTELRGIIINKSNIYEVFTMIISTLFLLQITLRFWCYIV
jgi:hypothetical protein